MEPIESLVACKTCNGRRVVSVIVHRGRDFTDSDEFTCPDCDGRGSVWTDEQQPQETTMSDNMILQMHAATAEILLESAKVAMAALRSVADQFDALRAVAADAVASPDMEGNKRDMLALWVEFADSLRAAADLVGRGPMPADQFRDELFAMLNVSMWIPGEHGTAKERANNIAQAYSGRVVRERE